MSPPEFSFRSLNSAMCQSSHKLPLIVNESVRLLENIRFFQFNKIDFYMVTNFFTNDTILSGSRCFRTPGC